MAPNVVTASKSEEERILTDTPSGSAAKSEGASDSEDASGSEEVSDAKEISGYEKASAPATATPSASSDEANSSYSTSPPQSGVPTPFAEHPNRLFVVRQYQVYTDAKLLNDKGFMTLTLTQE